jgi:hypothetical protein
MDEVLTIEEIERRFSGEWVLIVDPELDPQLNVLRGKVMFHDRDRDAVYRRSAELRAERVAFRHVGPWPKDVAFIL